ncbi:hypothetical protein U1Q18_043692 [Sarracenia purpurea var. burkii]
MRMSIVAVVIAVAVGISEQWSVSGECGGWQKKSGVEKGVTRVLYRQSCHREEFTYMMFLFGISRRPAREERVGYYAMISRSRCNETSRDCTGSKVATLGGRRLN